METGKSVSPMKNRPKHLPASGGFCVSAKRLRRFAEKEKRCWRTKQIRWPLSSRMAGHLRKKATATAPGPAWVPTTLPTTVCGREAM